MLGCLSEPEQAWICLNPCANPSEDEKTSASTDRPRKFENESRGDFIADSSRGRKGPSAADYSAIPEGVEFELPMALGPIAPADCALRAADPIAAKLNGG